MNFIYLSWCRSFPSPNSPYWLISKHNIVPIFFNILYSIELLTNNINGLISLSLLKCLTKTINNLETCFRSISNFIPQILVCFFEMGSSFRVTNDHPFNFHFFKLFWSNFSGIGSTSKLRTILSSYHNILILFGELSSDKMKEDGCNHNI